MDTVAGGRLPPPHLILFILDSAQHVTGPELDQVWGSEEAPSGCRGPVRLSLYFTLLYKFGVLLFIQFSSVHCSDDRT